MTTMPNDTIPAQIDREALTLAAYDSEHVRARLIARALVEAQRRGMRAALGVARNRVDICADAVEKVKSGDLYPDIPTALASERCAHLEASHIYAAIRKLMESSDGNA